MKDVSYVSKKWEKIHNKSIKENEISEYINCINFYISKLQYTDPLKLYKLSRNLYFEIANLYYIKDKNIEEFCGNLYLCARCLSYIINNMDFKKINNDFEMKCFTLLCYYISIDEWKEIDNFIYKENIIYQLAKGNFNKCKEKSLSNKILDNEINNIILSIVEFNSKQLNNSLIQRINSIRRLPIDYLIPIDIWSIALIKIAKKYGLNYNLNVIEIPNEMIENTIIINKDKWKLPF